MCIVIDARLVRFSTVCRVVPRVVVRRGLVRDVSYADASPASRVSLRIHVYVFLHRSVGCIALDHLADARGGSSSRLASPSPSSSSSSS